MKVSDLVLFALAGIGLFMVGFWVVRFFRHSYQIGVNLNATLREAVELMRQYRGDFAFLRRLQEAAGPNFGVPETPGPIPEVPPEPPARRPFPTPVYDRFIKKPEEPDAPLEDVDMTGDEEDLIDREKVDYLRELGIKGEEPEARPPGREVNAE